MDASLEERPKAKKLSSLTAAFQFLKPYRWVIVAASVALVITAGVTLSIGQGLRMIVDRGFAQGSESLLQDSIVWFSALVVLLAAGTFARFYLVSWIGERVSADIRRDVFSHIVRLHPGFFEENSPGEIQSRVTTDTLLLQTVIGSSVSIALRNILMFIGGLALMVITNPKLSITVLLAVPVVIAPIILFGRRVRSLSRTSQDRIADLGQHVGEQLRAIKTVQAFSREASAEQRFFVHVEAAFDTAVRRIRQRSWLISIVMLLVLSALVLMLWVGGQDVLSGRTSPGELAAFVFYAFIVAGSVGSISEVISDLQRAAGAMERLIELLHTPSEITGADADTAFAKKSQSASASPAVSETMLSFDRVSFCYATRPEVTVLDQVSFSVQRGETVALVGPSGAGKSTLFDLVLRFYDPAQGEISIAGTSLQRQSLRTLRQQIALVPQEPALFSGTVADNIRFGALPERDDEITEDEVRAAADAAFVTDFVNELPQGFDTPLGERGTGLSGGQRQRLAIARAILKDAPLLLLDEATSALDSESEHVIQQALETLSANRTTMVIAHRLATVRNADRIVVLDHGRVIAVGTHEVLMRECELYERLARRQFASQDSGPVRLLA